MENLIELFTMINCDQHLFHTFLPDSDIDHPNTFQQFMDLKTNHERVDFLLGKMDPLLKDIRLKKDGKIDTIAVALRQEGNTRFQLGDWGGALKFYTKSVAIAKTKSVMALSYGNRSAVLLKLHLTKECLADIDRALQNDFPSHLKPKLIARQNLAAASARQREIKYHDSIPVIPVSERNPKIQNGKNCIEIKNNSKFGRHIVATRNIEIGEVLSVEEPFACTLNVDDFDHCHECLEICYNLIPCETCNEIMYCSDNCKQKARDKFHKYECVFLKAINSFVSLLHPILPFKLVCLMRNELENPEKFRKQQDEKYSSDRYNEIYNLQIHTELTSPKVLFRQTEFIAYLYYVLVKFTKFFDGPNPDAVKKTFKELMVRHYYICDLNASKIYELVNIDKMRNRKINPIGWGLYALSSLYNHSCAPNVSTSLHGPVKVARAIKSIKKGEQCFIDYGVSYAHEPKIKRQSRLLENTNFFCECVACLGNWPQQELAPSQGLNCMFLMEVLAERDPDKIKAVVPIIQNLLKSVEKFEPCKETIILSAIIRYCFIALGNTRVQF